MKKRRMPKFKIYEPGYHYADYKGYHIILQEPGGSGNEDDEDWYIIVTDESGSYCYEGWWSDSEDKTKEEAFLEACRGSIIP